MGNHLTSDVHQRAPHRCLIRRAVQAFPLRRAHGLLVLCSRTSPGAEGWSWENRSHVYDPGKMLVLGLRLFFGVGPFELQRKLMLSWGLDHFRCNKNGRPLFLGPIHTREARHFCSEDRRGPPSPSVRAVTTNPACLR